MCLSEAHIAGGNFANVRLDPDTAADLLGEIAFSLPCALPDVDWAALPLASIEWSRLFQTAEDIIAYWQGAIDGEYYT